jgi:hypothetical protein
VETCVGYEEFQIIIISTRYLAGEKSMFGKAEQKTQIIKIFLSNGFHMTSPETH